MDVQAKRVVEIEISYAGSIVWVNVDGQCALRIANPGGQVLVNDTRPPKEVKYTGPLTPEQLDVANKFLAATADQHPLPKSRHDRSCKEGG